MAKKRLDVMLTEQNLVSSRERAKTTIMAGLVLVNGQKIDKPGTMVKEDAVIRVLGDSIGYVSRGGLKLAKAIKEFKRFSCSRYWRFNWWFYRLFFAKWSKKSFCYRCRLWTISMVIAYR